MILTEENRKKIRILGKGIKDTIDGTKPKLDLKYLAEKMHVKIIQDATLDESLQIEVCGLKYYDEDTANCQCDYTKADVEKNFKTLQETYCSEYENWLDEMCDDKESEPSQKDEEHVLTAINDAHARIFIEMYQATNGDWCDEVKKIIKTLIDSHGGMYSEWDEMNISFYYLGFKCQYSFFVQEGIAVFDETTEEWIEDILFEAIPNA